MSILRVLREREIHRVPSRLPAYDAGCANAGASHFTKGPRLDLLLEREDVNLVLNVLNSRHLRSVTGERLNKQVDKPLPSPSSLGFTK